MQSMKGDVFEVLANAIRVYPKVLLRILPFTMLLTCFYVVEYFVINKHFISSHGAILSFVGILTVVSIFFVCAIIMLANGVIVRKPIGYVAASIKALRRFIPFLIVGVLSTLIFGFGTLLLIVPGIYLIVKLLFARFAVLIEDKGIWKSLKYSFKLVKGNWWSTFLILVIYIALHMVVNHMAMHHMISHVGKMPFHKLSLFNILFVRYALPATIASIVYILIVSPLSSSIMLCQYYNLKERQKQPTKVTGQEQLKSKVETENIFPKRPVLLKWSMALFLIFVFLGFFGVFLRSCLFANFYHGGTGFFYIFLIVYTIILSLFMLGIWFGHRWAKWVYITILVLSSISLFMGTTSYTFPSTPHLVTLAGSMTERIINGITGYTQAIAALLSIGFLMPRSVSNWFKKCKFSRRGQQV